MAADPIHELSRKRASRWHRLLQPPLPLVHSAASKRQVLPLGPRNLYIGGAGNRVDGFINVDLYPLPGIDVACDAEHLPFRDGVFDLVDCNAVIEHTPSPRALVGEIRRCVKPGGGCHLVAPFCHPFHEYPKDYWRFTEDGLCELVKPMEIIETGWQTGPTATLLITLIEYVKLWMPASWMKKGVWVVLGWVLSPLRYLDLLLANRPDAKQIGNHAYVWARKST